MKLIGNGRLVLTEPIQECPHTPDANPDWQESVVLYFWEPQQECYGFFRIGHEPNRELGASIVLWKNLWVGGEYYKNCHYVPFADVERFRDGFGGGPTSRYRFDGKHHWTITDGDISARLVMEDAHPPFDFLPAQHNLGEVAANHIEAAGTVTGEVQFRGRSYSISNALAHRDHSWGPRKWESMRTHRWAPAVFGKNFVTHAVGMIGPDRTMSRFGFVMRDDTLIIPRSVDIVTLVEADGLTSRGGVVTLTLESGETIEVVYKPVAPGAFSFHRGYPCNDLLCTVTSGNHTGFGVFESGDNTLGGKERPTQELLISGIIDNGVFPFQRGSSLVRS